LESWLGEILGPPVYPLDHQYENLLIRYQFLLRNRLHSKSESLTSGFFDDTSSQHY
jgi:hypothetical protein